MAINDAARLIDADYIATLHPEKMRWFKHFSKNPRATGHVSAHKFKPSFTDYVDEWHPDCQSGWTSAGSAVLIALKMGFQRVIMLGCPLESTGYAEGAEGFAVDHGRRVGLAGVGSNLIAEHRRALREEADTGKFKGKVFSMSGYTAKILGKPNWRNTDGHDKGKGRLAIPVTA